MKKSFVKSIRLVGMFLLGSVAMVGCYEGDDNVDYVQEKPTPEPERVEPKYYVYCTVEDENENALEAEITLFRDGTEIAKQTTSSLSMDVKQSGSYSVQVKRMGYVTVTKPAKFMPVGADGTVSTVLFEVTLHESELPAGADEPVNDDPVVDAPTEEEIDEMVETIGSLFDEYEIEGVSNIAVSAFESELIVGYDEAGNPIKVPAICVDADCALKDIVSDPVIQFPALVTGGYVHGPVAEMSRALTPADVWEARANRFFGVVAPGFVKNVQVLTYNNPNRYPIKGFRVREFFIKHDLAFDCDGTVLSAKVQYCYYGRLTALHVDDSHDNHDDSHDDHHDNGGTAWGGGTTGR